MTYIVSGGALNSTHSSNFSAYVVIVWNALSIDQCDFGSVGKFKRSLKSTDLSATLNQHFTLVFVYTAVR